MMNSGQTYQIKKYRKKTDLKIIYVATPAKSVLLNYLLFYIFLIPYILVAYFKYKPDVLYSRYMASEIVITMIMKLLGCRYIAEVNGAFLDELRLKKSNSLLIKAVKIFENRLFNVADKIIVVTSGLKDYINCTFNIAIDKIAVVNNGVNTDISRPLDINKCKEELGLDKNRDYIVFVGSLRLWHGVNRLVEIVKYLSEKKDNICLLVVGSGPEEERLSKQISEASLTNKILMTGKVQHERVPLYIGSSLVCIAPYPDTVVSQHGFSSLKIREYMSCGRPIVTTNVGGLYEFVAENGCGTVVENNTDYEIAETILETINNKQEWQNISNTARRYATDNLSWDSAANNIISIINSSS